MEQIEELREDGNHITALLSYSDLIQLGGYAAVEYTGGPSMVFRMGREDGEEKDIVHGDSNQGFIEKAQANGFSKRELVALMGSHTIGFANMENAGS